MLNHRRALTAAIMTMSFSAYASSSVKIVGNNGDIVPIEQLAAQTSATSTSTPAITLSPSTQRTPEENIDQIKQRLKTEFASFEDALLVMDNLSDIEKSALRDWAVDKYVAERRDVVRQKERARLEETKLQVERDMGTKRVINDPELIRKNRIIEADALAAESAPLYESTIKIDTQNIDPYGNQIININSVLNAPTAISFFDSLGTPYPIVKVSPEETSAFKVETINQNILVVKAESAFQTVTGFVFLEGVQQPIPMRLTSNPKAESDIKRNIVLPSISPLSTEKTELIMAELSTQRGENDPVMYQFLNNRHVPKAIPQKITGLDSSSLAWKYNGHMYIRTQHYMPYDKIRVSSLGIWYVFKAPIRQTYWFSVNGKEVEASIGPINRESGELKTVGVGGRIK